MRTSLLEFDNTRLFRKSRIRVSYYSGGREGTRIMSSRIANCESRIANCELRIANRELLLARLLDGTLEDRVALVGLLLGE
jgi:hypothetical protein